MALTKEEFLRKMTENKILVSPEAVEKTPGITKEETDKIAALHKGKGILTAEDIKQYTARQEESFNIITNITEEFFTGSREIPRSYYTSKYEKMRGIITGKSIKKFISMSNLPPRGEFFLIGMVRDVEDTQIVIEDSTKSATVRFSDPSLIRGCKNDDVIALRAVVAGPNIFGKEITYPGVPVRPLFRGKGRAMFVSDMHLEQVPASVADKTFEIAKKKKADRVFIAGDIGETDILEKADFEGLVFIIPGNADGPGFPQKPLKTGKSNIISLSNPAMVRTGGLNVLMCHDFNKEWIEKRHIGEPTTGITEDMLVMDTVPDIIHCGHTHAPQIEHYKSITIVNSGSALADFRPVIVDFEDRTAEFTIK